MATVITEAPDATPSSIVAEGRGPYGGRPLPESILHAAWRRAGRSGVLLRSGDGRTYRVLYPGRPAGGQGPDFLDAVLETEDGSRLCGDIEIHVRSSDWRHHGHARDRRYNGVLFHIALSDSGGAAVTSSGRTIPLLVLGKSVARSGGRGFSRDQQPAEAGAMPMPFLDLGAAGDERFLNRSEGYLHDITVMGADQAIYEGLLDCMGFPRNRAGFRRLARRLPWSALLADASVDADPPGRIGHTLLWAAGFGTKPHRAPLLVGNSPEWARQPGRPDNRPENRVRGAAIILGRALAHGGPSQFCVSVVSASEAAGLSESFTAQVGRGRSFVGKGRAAEIVVDAVLPFVHALAKARRDAGLASRALDHYRRHPGLPPNAILREAALVVSSALMVPAGPSAREQQGLIHTYRMMTSRIVRPRQLPLV